MIKVKNLYKTYINGPIETKVLRGIDLHIQKGEFVSIMGRSGAGKSTLLYQMSLLDTQTSGDITINGTPTENLSYKERVSFRLQNMGYVFQDYALIPELTAAENIMIPLIMQGMTKQTAYEKALHYLNEVEIVDKSGNLPNQMSGGEQQRVSVSRAIAHEPKILFADEPTANLDAESAQNIMSLLSSLHKKGQTIVMVTHENEYSKYADRLIHISDGIIDKRENLHSNK